MGFYAPAQIVRDAREHGVEVRPVDVNRSDWDCTLEPTAAAGGGLALRLGLRLVKGLREAEMRRLVERRGDGYPDLAELRRRAGVSTAVLDGLARADALRSLGLDRRGGLWAALGLDGTGREAEPPPLFAWAEGAAARPEPPVALPAMDEGGEIAQDYAGLGLTLRRHPLALLRPRLEAGRRRPYSVPLVPAAALRGLTDGVRITVAGLVLVRQRPGTASGVVFVTLEDETGVANLIVWPGVFERFRRVALAAQLLLVEGRLQRQGEVVHVIAEGLTDRTDLLRRLGEEEDGEPGDRDFRSPVARADEARRPTRDHRRPKGFTSRDFR